MRWLTDLPGRTGDLVLPSSHPERVPEASMPLGELAAIVRHSPRGNAYLSLEPDLRTFATDDGALTWAAAPRHALSVGGVHVTGDGTRLLTDFRDALSEARFSKVMLFPVAAAERRLVRSAGFRSLMVGAEAFVDTATFTLAGRKHADLRQMVNRGKKRYGVTVHEVDPRRVAASLDHLYHHWLDGRPLADPMALLIGTPCFDRPLGRRYFAARSADRPDAVAFVTVTPGWDGRGWGVDVMAREPDAPAGAMDVLLTEVITRLADEGVEVVSLGACPMAERTALPRRDSRFLRAIFRWLYRSSLGNGLFPFQSLALYKDKFRPRWEAVHIASWPKLNAWSLYAGCRMWGLFGRPPLTPLPAPPSEPRRLGV
ncbi:MAG: DUF2156 domain-containing protein [Deltaproteobacteria bacterium]|nr:MAG: DUF2156 domain-containing protein [Deltaproteobacteria bacterium]